MLHIHCVNALETVAHFCKSSSDYSDIVSALQEGVKYWKTFKREYLKITKGYGKQTFKRGLNV